MLKVLCVVRATYPSWAHSCICLHPLVVMPYPMTPVPPAVSDWQDLGLAMQAAADSKTVTPLGSLAQQLYSLACTKVCPSRLSPHPPWLAFTATQSRYPSFFSPEMSEFALFNVHVGIFGEGFFINLQVSCARRGEAVVSHVHGPTSRAPRLGRFSRQPVHKY